MMNSNTLCFTTVVAGQIYCDYVPLYIYFITAAYPEAFIRIYVRGNTSEIMLERIRRLTCNDNWSVVFNYGEEFPKDASSIQTLRFLIKDAELEKHSYIYTGDVDILIAKEEFPLVEQHKEHCDFLGLPYSNARRPKSERLTGLHFVKSFEYYNRIEPHLEKYRELLRANKFTRVRDDEVAYALCNDAGMIPREEVKCGLGPDDFSYGTQTYNFRPHHGIHLRAFNGSQAPDDGAVMCSTSRAYKSYLKAIKKVYNKDVVNLVEELHPSIQLQIKRMLGC